MLHHRLSSYPIPTGAHYGVSISTETNTVLVQLQDKRAEQIRVRMTPEEARWMAKDLIEKAARCEGKCCGCERPCSDSCQYHQDYWKPSFHKAATLLLEKYEDKPCDCEAVSDCVRCSIVAVAKRMVELIDDSPATSTEEHERK